MKTTTYTEEKLNEIGKTLVWMYTKSGSGRVRFAGEVSRFSDCFEGLTIFTGLDADTIEEIREDDPDFDAEGLDEWTVEDNGGNVWLTGREEIEARTGYIHLDSETRYVEELAKLSRDDYEAIVEEEKHRFIDEDIYEYAKRKLEK